MTKIDDLFDLLDLDAAIGGGYVRTQVHPTMPLTIYNYTETAAYEGVWTPVTKQCRGLIVDSDTTEVLARPFPKFMNLGQDGAHIGDADDAVVVTDKQDGSLGILYPTGDGGYAVATRGSFASEQAQHATTVWQDRYADTFTPRPGVTYLFEIVYPKNRIVVDYGGLDDLVLLGAVDIATGRTLTVSDAAAHGWPGPVTETFPHRSLAEAMAAPDRPGREGLVVHYVNDDQRIKIKQSDYVALHKLVTGMNERIVWEHLGTGADLADLIAPLPDEFHAWVRQVAARLIDRREGIAAAAQVGHELILDSLPADWTRRDYAMAASTHPLRPWLFNLLDGRDPRPGIWKTLRPSGAVTMTSQTEESA